MAYDFTGVPLFEDMVTERLRHCALDIGAARSYQIPPSLAIVPEDLPAVYNMVGSTFNAQVALATQGLNAIPTVYIQRWIISPFAQGVQDTTIGHEMWSNALQWFSKVQHYYFKQPRLKTTLVGTDLNGHDLAKDLPYCMGILPAPDESPFVRHTGLKPAQIVAGGGEYAVIDFQLNIVMVSG